MDRSLETNKKDEPSTDDGWFTRPARDKLSDGFRESHEKALKEIAEPINSPYILQVDQTRMLKHLVKWLIKPARNSKEIDPEDQHAVLRNLGRLLSKRPKIMKNDAENFDPLCHVIAELFSCWIVRGCEAVLVKGSSMSAAERKNREMEAESEFGSWFIDITKNAKKRNDQWYEADLNYMEPWSRLRPGMEAFLEGWAAGVDEKLRTTTAPTRTKQTDSGLGCIALRTMATINSRRISQETAERLAALEAWMGPGENQLSNEIVSTQQAAWDRYLLERSMRGWSKRSVKLLDEMTGRTPKESLARLRKM